MSHRASGRHATISPPWRPSVRRFVVLSTRSRFLRAPVLTLVILALGASDPAPASQPVTHTVPDQYATIQAAIDAAGAGETVLVKAGVYREALRLKSGLCIQGADRDTCRIQAVPGACAVVTAVDCQGASIHNLTFEGDGTRFRNVFGIGAVWDADEDVLTPSHVTAGTPAAEAGLKHGVQLIRLDGQPVGGNPDRATFLLTDPDRPSVLELSTADAGRTVTLRPDRVPTRLAFPYGLALVDSSVTVRNCHIRGMGAAGVLVSGPRARVRLAQNRCESNGTHGIVLRRGAGGLVEENACERNAQRGIAVVGAGTTATLRQNVCRSNTSAGIGLEAGAGGTAERNACEQNALEGIRVGGAGTVVRLLNNRCIDNAADGICFHGGASGQVEANLCRNNQGNGIWIIDRGTTPTLEANRCSGNLRSGICFGRGAGGMGRANICLANRLFGIVIGNAGSHPSLVANTCHGNGRSGIHVDRWCSVVVQANDCRSNKEHGISSFSNKTRLDRNQCRENQQSGIFLHYARGQVAGNICESNGGFGILVSHAGPRLKQNVCRANRRSGILVRGDQATPSLESNHCNNNREWGIETAAGARPTITDDNETVDNKAGPMSPMSRPVRTQSSSDSTGDGK